MKALILNVSIWLFCIAAPYPLPARGASPADSLRVALKTAKGADRMHTLYALFKTFVYRDLDSALRYADWALQEAIALRDSLAMARMYRARGSVRMYRGELKSAIADMERGLAIAKRRPADKDNIAFFLLNDLGLAYNNIGRFDRAMEYHFRYLAEAEERENQKSVSISLNNIGLVYYQLADYANATKYYERAIAIKEQIGDRREMEKFLVNLSNCLVMTGHYRRGLALLQKALAECGDGCAPEILIAAHIAMGNAYLKKGEYGRAEKALKKGLAMARKATAHERQSTALRLLAKLALEQKQPAVALARLYEAQRVAQAANLPIEQMKNNRIYAIAHSALGHYEASNQYWQRYNKQSEEYVKKFSGNMVEKIARVQAAYEEKANLKQIASQQKLVETKQKALTRSTTQFIAISTLTGLVVAALIGMGMMYRRKREDNIDISEQNSQLKADKSDLEATVVERTQELDESGTLLSQLNKEMKHLMHKISHDVQGPVSTIQGMCALAISEVKHPDALKYFEMTGNTANTIDSIITRLQFTMEINNAELHAERVNLLKVAHSAWEAVGENRRLGNKEDIPNDFIVNYDIDNTIHVNSSYRMVCTILGNLLDNAVKFRNSAARKPPFAKITVQEKKKHVEIKVIDNGIGVPENIREEMFKLFVRGISKHESTEGIGLYMANMAAGRIGATIQLGANKKGFTEMVLKIPKSFKFEEPKRDKDGNKIATWIPKDEL